MPAKSFCCDAGPLTFLTSVTAEHLSGFDRMVLEFTAPVTSYWIRYVPLPVTEDPSDRVVVLQGDHALQITMGATGIDRTVDPVHQIYTGPGRIAVGSGPVIELGPSAKLLSRNYVSVVWVLAGCRV